MPIEVLTGAADKNAEICSACKVRFESGYRHQRRQVRDGIFSSFVEDRTEFCPLKGEWTDDLLGNEVKIR